LESQGGSSQFTTTLKEISAAQQQIITQQKVVEDASRPIANTMGAMAEIRGTIAYFTQKYGSAEEYQAFLARQRDENAQRKAQRENDLRNFRPEVVRTVRRGGWWIFGWRDEVVEYNYSGQHHLQNLLKAATGDMQLVEAKMAGVANDQAAAKREISKSETQLKSLDKSLEHQTTLFKQAMSTLDQSFQNLAKLEETAAKHCAAFDLASKTATVKLLTSMEYLAQQTAIGSGGAVSFSESITSAVSKAKDTLEFVDLNDSLADLIASCEDLISNLAPLTTVVAELGTKISTASLPATLPRIQMMEE